MDRKPELPDESRIVLWYAVHHVREDGRETGQVVFYTQEDKAKEAAKKHGTGGEHVLRITAEYVLQVAPGRAYLLEAIGAADFLDQLKKSALGKLTIEEQKALGLTSLAHELYAYTRRG